MGSAATQAAGRGVLVSKMASVYASLLGRRYMPTAISPADPPSPACLAYAPVGKLCALNAVGEVAKEATGLPRLTNENIADHAVAIAVHPGILS